MATLRPISYDRTTALELAKSAIRARNEPESEAAPFLSAIERDVADGSASGVLRLHEDRVIGIALWAPSSAIGVTIEVLFSVAGFQSVDDYREFYGEVVASVGARRPRSWRLGGSHGRRRGAGHARPRIRPVRALGDAVPFRSAYAGTFRVSGPPHSPSREMRPGSRACTSSPTGTTSTGISSSRTPTRSGTRRFKCGTSCAVAGESSFRGRPSSSRQGGRIVAATLVVRAPYGPLVADVMVDPPLQGRGLGRAVVTATVRALRDRKESVIVLNVTDGNTRAIRLYDRIGFVRTLGPSGTVGTRPSESGSPRRPGRTVPSPSVGPPLAGGNRVGAARRTTSPSRGRRRRSSRPQRDTFPAPPRCS